MTLDEIARHMETAVQHSHSHTADWILARGLHLLLAQRNGTHTLRLSRAQVAPSALEVRICREAFHVPDDAEYTTGTGGRPAHNFVQLEWPHEP
jgi:hypothetical protein